MVPVLTSQSNQAISSFFQFLFVFLAMASQDCRFVFFFSAISLKLALSRAVRSKKKTFDVYGRRESSPGTQIQRGKVGANESSPETQSG